MSRLVWILAFCLNSEIIFAQKNYNDSIILKIGLPMTNITKKEDLKLKVVVANTSPRKIQVYRELIEGYMFHIYANFNLLIENKKKGIFKKYNRGSLYSMVPTTDTVDNIDKIILDPGDSVTNYYHLDNVYLFEPASYRIKCIYRNNILSKNKIESGWLYFVVRKKIYVTKYYDD